MNRIHLFFHLLKTKGLLATLRISFEKLFYLCYFILERILNLRSHFVFNDKKYAYWKQTNPLARTERLIEIPIFADLVQKNKSKRIMELGNVLYHYISNDHTGHTVVDKYEQCAGVINEDIISYKTDKKFDLIISVSTLEHVGWEENPKEESKCIAAIDNMKKLTKKGGRIIFSVPLGFNHFLDKAIEQGRIKLDEQYFMKRVSLTNRWKQCSYAQARKVKYAYPFVCGNAITVGVIRV